MLVSFTLNVTENNSKTGVGKYKQKQLEKVFPEVCHLHIQYPKFFALQEVFLGNGHECHGALNCETMLDLTQKAAELPHQLLSSRQTRMEAPHGKDRKKNFFLTLN